MLWVATSLPCESYCINPYLDVPCLAMGLPSDLITAAAARKLLGISPIKMRDLLKEGALPYYADPLDKRKKLVSKRDVLALIVPKAEAA
jgi:hypothetical protein